MPTLGSLTSGSLKFLLGWTLCFLWRLVPYRPPNVEPILTTMMPFSKRFGILGAFLFGFVSISAVDAAQGLIGSWTWITASAYGALGIGAALFFQGREVRRMHYIAYAIVGTLLYDAFTGLTLGPLLFGQPFMEALTGQLPFTAMHLIGNIFFAGTLSPLIERWVTENDALEGASLRSLLMRKS